MNSLDHFIDKRIGEAGLKPQPEADRRTQIRRVTLDLTGLPPTPEEVEQFIADRSPEAYPKLVDRLLASKAYGERMALAWNLAKPIYGNGRPQNAAVRLTPHTIRLSCQLLEIKVSESCL